MARARRIRPEPGLLPAPDLADERVLRQVAGIRPCREGSIRLEVEEAHGKLRVHHYGHGGAGITLSWGTAQEVVRMLAERLPPPSLVAVLGAGVIGLTTAHVLLERGYGVRVYAREFSPQTTSDTAGGLWAPAYVARGRSSADRKRFETMLRSAHARFISLLGDEWGVSRCAFYATPGDAAELDEKPNDLSPVARAFDRLPFPGMRPPGHEYRTLLIETPVYMPRLAAEVQCLGAELKRHAFTCADELAELEEAAAINCLGASAGTITLDPDLVPVRGQLVHVEPQALEYSLCHPDAYLLSRRDAIVLGGTFEPGVAEAVPEEAAGRLILERNREFFREPVKR